MRALCNRAVQYRAGNHAVVCVNQFARSNLRYFRTQNGTQEAGFVDLRTTQGNYALSVQTACCKQTANGNYILIIDGPNGFVRTDWLDEMNVCATQTGRVRTAKFMCFDVGSVFRRHVCACCFTHMDFTFGQAAQYQQAAFEVFGGEASFTEGTGEGCWRLRRV